MSMVVNDSWVVEQLLAERVHTDQAGRDEVWNGVYVVSPIANNIHQRIVIRVAFAFQNVLELDKGDQIFPGLNVSDREEGWLQNHRVPDLGVVLSGNPAKDCGTHWCGGPDFLVEVVSKGDLAREKRPFYAKIGVRELLVIDRDPWSLELYRLRGDELTEAGVSRPDDSAVVTSLVLPLTFRLVPGEERPSIEIERTDGEGRWLI